MNVTFDRANGQGQCFGNFFNRTVFDKPQHENVAQRVFKPSDRIQHALHLLSIASNDLGRRMRVDHVRRVGQRRRFSLTLPPTAKLHVTRRRKHEGPQLLALAAHCSQRPNELGERLGGLLLSRVMIAVIA